MMNQKRDHTSRFDCGAAREKLNPAEIKVPPIGERKLCLCKRLLAAPDYATRLIDFKSPRRFFRDPDWVI